MRISNGCACGLQKHCDCDYATAGDLREQISEVRLSPDGKTYICDRCDKYWLPGEDPGCERCSQLWDRIDTLEGRDPTNIQQESFPEDGIDLSEELK